LSVVKVPDIIIAIDGYSSTGKSSFAKTVAKEFGFLYLDSGALYRAVTLYAREEGFISRLGTVSSQLEESLKTLDIHFDQSGKTFLGTRCVESGIRSMEVSSQVSIIAAVPYVREFVDKKLHEFGQKGRIVMDGRDIGSTVFPNAEIKVFMIANEKIRATRRYNELYAKGDRPSIEDVLANLRERDYIDSHREVSPLQQAKDAFVLDNSKMTIREEVAWLRGLIQGKCGILQ